MTERRKEPRRPDDKLAFYPWYPRDFNADGPVAVMTLEEECCYRRLLDYQWLNGSVPSEVALVARICKNVPVRRMARIWGIVGPLFPGGKNRRLEREREDIVRSLEAKSAHGKKGADARWNPIPEHPGPDARAMPGVCYPEAEAKAESSTKPQRARVLAAIGESEDLASVCRVAGNPEALCMEIMALLDGMRGTPPTVDAVRLALRDMAVTGERPSGKMLRAFVRKAGEPEGNGKPGYTGYQEYKT